MDLDFDSDPELKKLRDEYLDSLEERLVAIRSFVKLSADSRDQKTMDNCKLVVHRLVGASGTYGFPSLSKIAAQVEELFGENPDMAKIDSGLKILDEALLVTQKAQDPTEAFGKLRSLLNDEL